MSPPRRKEREEKSLPRSARECVCQVNPRTAAAACLAGNACERHDRAVIPCRRPSRAQARQASPSERRRVPKVHRARPIFFAVGDETGSSRGEMARVTRRSGSIVSFRFEMHACGRRTAVLCCWRETHSGAESSPPALSSRATRRARVREERGGGGSKRERRRRRQAYHRTAQCAC